MVSTTISKEIFRLSDRKFARLNALMARIAAICGVFNGLTNFLVLVLNGKLPASVMFPVISAGGIVFIFLYSLFVYREKFKLTQIIGFVLGVGAIVLLNL